jgi:hypothetical protein
LYKLRQVPEILQRFSKHCKSGRMNVRGCNIINCIVIETVFVIIIMTILIIILALVFEYICNVIPDFKIMTTSIVFWEISDKKVLHEMPVTQGLNSI